MQGLLGSRPASVLHVPASKAPRVVVVVVVVEVVVVVVVVVVVIAPRDLEHFTMNTETRVPVPESRAKVPRL